MRLPWFVKERGWNDRMDGPTLLSEAGDQLRSRNGRNGVLGGQGRMGRLSWCRASDPRLRRQFCCALSALLAFDRAPPTEQVRFRSCAQAAPDAKVGVSHMHRFYIAPEAWNIQPLALDAAESKHATQVLRMKAGDRATVFDGCGTEAIVELGAPQDRSLPLRLLQTSRSAPLASRITLAQAIPKGKTMELIVQKATELGVDTIAPLISERTVVQLDKEDGEDKREKWQRVALEACKQSGRNWIPNVLAPSTVRQFLDDQGRDFDFALVASLQPDAKPLYQQIAFFREQQPGITPASVLVLVGPEGDFTPAEVGTARSAGCLPLTLGPLVLRSETAAIHCLSILNYELFRS